MKNRCGQHSARGAFSESLVEMLEVPRSSGSNHGNLDGCRDLARQIQVIALLCAVAVHAGEKNLAGAKGRDALPPLDSVQFRSGSAAVGVNLGSAVLSPGIDCHDNALTSE